uniref:Zinc finger PMZ-type domain-containing protein n=1 Tax=Lactuca sativa TaxID=4236 RepID=A0A9R1W003_LACSA|nr:hypothetical protein LSAT_V11C300141690 [Lactuca sativa]
MSMEDADLGEGDTILNPQDENIPKVGMMFDSENELEDYFNKYTYQIGFGVRKASTRTKKCIATTYYSDVPEESSKTNCQAKICVIAYGDGRCTISRVFLEHNHALSPQKSRFHRSHKKMDSYAKRRLELNDYAGIPSNKSFHSLLVEAKGYDNLPFSEIDCRSYIAKVRQLRLGQGDAEALRNYFVRMQKRSSNFFYVIDMDDEGHMQNFAPFVGVNHHGQSILFGCGLLSREDTKTYVWLFKSWLECMNGRAPKAIITDQCRSMQGASTDTQKFEDGWCKLVEKHRFEKNEWLCSLFNDRSRWVPIYVKVNFWAGMSTTQRSESMNAFFFFFDVCVNSKTSLQQFVEQYDNALKSKIEKENKADFEPLNSSYKLRQFQEAYTNAIFKLFQDELRGMLFCNFLLVKVDGAQYVFCVIDIIEGKHGDLKKELYDAIAFDVQCSCHSFEFHGIIFRHMVKILIEKDVKEIHPRFILSQWRKDVNHGHHSVINCYEDLMSGENAKQSDYLCCNFYEVAHIANSHEKYEYLVNCINMAKEKLNDDSFWGCSSNVNWIVEDVCVPDSTKKLLPPLQVRSKGHPPSKRKESRAERVMKKNRKKNVLEKTDNIQKDPMGPSREHGEISYKDEPNYQFDLNAPV